MPTFINWDGYMKQFSIQILIEQRCAELGYGASDFIFRTHPKSYDFTRRELDKLYAGEVNGGLNIIKKIHTALDLPKEVVDAALTATLLEKDKTYKPNAYVLTANNGRPRQITIAGLCGAVRYKTIPIPDSIEPDQYVEYSFGQMEINKGNIGKFFDEIVGVRINFTNRKSISFNLNKQIIGQSEHSVAPGISYVTLR